MRQQTLQIRDVTYEKFLDGVEANGLSLTPAESQTLDLGSAALEIIPSPGDDYSSLNDYSVCAYLTCGENGFFFTGDASKPEEKDLLSAGALDHVKADVLKVGHHGSRESSTDDFLYAISPINSSKCSRRSSSGIFRKPSRWPR